jgi:hypothetical protein
MCFFLRPARLIFVDVPLELKEYLLEYRKTCFCGNIVYGGGRIDRKIRTINSVRCAVDTLYCSANCRANATPTAGQPKASAACMIS